MIDNKITDSYTEGMGERIRWIRVTNNLSQGALGDKLGVSRQSISGYETERLSPSRTVLHRLCNIFNAYPAWVVYGIGGGGGISDEQLDQDALTPTQATLITLIRDNSEFAKKLQRKLWNEAAAH